MLRLLGLLVLLLTGWTPHAHAQQVIRGTVVDAETGDPLPSATVQRDGTTQGTVTNAAGQFELGQVPLPTTLVVRYIGYRSATVEVTPSTPMPLRIALTPSPVLLDEVIVDGEDLAIGIMRKVLAAKEAWRARLSDVQAEVYTRFMLYRRQELVQVREQIDAFYWRPEDGTREVILAERMRPANSGSFRFAGPLPIHNFYDDNISIGAFRLMGPTHPRALEVYRFTLGGYREQDGQRVYDIYFAPKQALATTLIGRLAVLDSAFVMLEVQARPHPDNVWPAPITDASVTFEQRFAAFGEGVWLPVDLTVRGRVQVGRLGAQHPPARYEQVSQLTRHVLNVPASDTLFASPGPFFDHPLKAQQDYLFRWNPGLIPMTPREVEALLGMDPRMTVRRAFRPEGLLAGYTAVDVEERAEPDPEEAETRRRLGIRPGLWAQFNRVDGWFTGMRRTLTWRQRLVLAGGLGYAWSRKRPAGEGQATYIWRDAADRRSAFVRLAGSWGTQSRGHSATYPALVTSLTTYGGYDAYYDYFDNRRAALTLGGTFAPWSVGLEVGVLAERHRSAERTNDYEGWLRANAQRPNPAIPEGDLRALHASLTLGTPTSVTYAPGQRSLRIDAEHSPATLLGSSFAYTTVRLDGQWRSATLGARRASPAMLHLRLRAGTARGAVPTQRWAVLDAATGPFAGWGAFRTLAHRPYEGDQYAALFWEHDFATLPFEVLGLWPLARANIGLSVFGAHGQMRRTTASDDATRIASRTSPGTHHELGVALTNFFNLPLRIDTAYRFDEPGWAFSLGIYRGTQR